MRVLILADVNKNAYEIIIGKLCYLYSSSE